ncbi:nucleoside hydrolase [Paenibacillus spongiae]|uniref:Nucleoside hydrolase n=1 Tax=Paenibacillus spongiae TaxID=2909671 RepID=A0ABY5S893_9BACL|nr:nucleoside hydrolase [Paenibacillus spongiae]UVI30142.1 nucleoside hydrolase [Paenibacillus spongiae]
MKPVILDVDTGIDDMMAIAYAAHSPELRLLGLTTQFGNISSEVATRNTLYVLEMLGQGDVPVYAGASKPFRRADVLGDAKHVHGEDGLGGALRGASPTGRAGSMTAAEFMVDQVRRMPGEITIIAVGPLTNLALAIEADPEFVSLVDEVVIMGGAATVPGNVTPYAEANIHSDPEAAAFVFRSGLPITMVGLDVTMKTLLPRTRLQEWRSDGTELSRFMADAADFYMDAYENFNPGIGGCALHDPLAVGVVIDPSFCKIVAMPIEVDTEDGAPALGQTRVNETGTAAQSPSIHVCVEVDAERFLAHFMSRVV